MMTILPIRLVLIEDDPTIREGFSYLFNKQPECQLVNAYPSAENALKKLKSDNPDLILLDIGLPGISGIEAIRQIKKKLPEVPVLMLTVHESENFIFHALTEGASGYLTKNCSPEKILHAIMEITSGGGSMSANVARVVFNSFRRSDDSPLSDRETQIIENIAAGMSRGQIAADLNITSETVKSHVKNIYRKLKVHSRADAIRYARESKLI
jgi:DNA-binding NarL/FixJ family response regulator